MPKTDEELREWRASLNKVTQGDWHVAEPLSIATSYSVIRRTDKGGFGEIVGRAKRDDAAHLAHCDPQTISELIKEVLEWRGQLPERPVLTHADIESIRNAALDEAAQIARMMAYSDECAIGEVKQRIHNAILTLKTPEREDG